MTKRRRRRTRLEMEREIHGGGFEHPSLNSEVNIAGSKGRGEGTQGDGPIGGCTKYTRGRNDGTWSRLPERRGTVSKKGRGVHPMCARHTVPGDGYLAC